MFRFTTLVTFVCWLPLGATGDDRLSFNQDIRPLLSENCYHCHGPDDSARAAGLRLDTEEGAKEWAIVAGDANDSEVVARVFATDPDTIMPPPDSERRLTDSQKQTIKRWIEQGAPYQRHWAFESPVLPKVPSQMLGDPIDRFVNRKLAEQGMRQADPANREILIRRLTFDLIGLPPSQHELDDYLSDPSPHATERLIDRLLADPRFGERMAADWLDVARYSDTYGYQVDRDRFVWPYRDWVIDAFNRNLPYDQFVTQQLAGDLLPDANRDQILATTFNRLHPQKVEGGSVPEEFRIEYIADRTQTVGTAFLGLTMECCRCHTHKYDPITQTEYYELASFFANIDEAGLYSYFTSSVPTPTLPLPTPQQERQMAKLRSAVDAAKSTFNEAVDASVKASLVDLASGLTIETAEPIETVDFESKVAAPNVQVDGRDGKAVELTGDDPVNLKNGNFRRDQPFSVSLWIKTPDVKKRAVVFHRSRAWTDAASRGYQLLIEDGRLSWSLIHFWPGNAIRIRTSKPIETQKWVHVTVTNDGSSTADGLAIWIDGHRATTQIVRDRLTKNITGGGGDTIAIGQRFRDRGFAGGHVDSVNVFDRELTELEIQLLAANDASSHWSTNEPATWSEPQKQTMARHLACRSDRHVSAMRDALAAARRKQCQLEDQLQEIMVMRETPGIRTTHRLNRGAYDDPAEPVQPGTPRAILPFGDNLQADRLGLAKWMLRPNHPLTSRVAVNRLWQLCFGSGLVRTPEDFGSQGQPPTHPELLDWLAIDFVDSGWDVKRMLKQIMMSATYQSDSDHPNQNVWQSDPENRLLARQNAYRLSAEMLRDQALAVSGQLVGRVGGPPVKPYELEASFKPTKRESGAGLYRRSLYTYWKRTGPAPAMMTLDAAKRDVCRVRRERTSSPLQAFVLLNGPQFVEAARAMAVKLLDQYRSSSRQQSGLMAIAFRQLTSRSPSAAELETVMELYANQLDYFQSNPKRATQYLSVGDYETPDRFDTPVLAATSVVIGTLMNFDESMMKR